MRLQRKYMIAIGAVTLWAAFAYGYLGVEDGSSGLSIFGLIHAFFFLPGLVVFHTVKDSHSNSDLPFIAGLSWVIYSVVAGLVVKCVCTIQKFINKNKPDDNTDRNRRGN